MPGSMVTSAQPARDPTAILPTTGGTPGNAATILTLMELTNLKLVNPKRQINEAVIMTLQMEWSKLYPVVVWLKTQRIFQWTYCF